jgi:hypothetical protein
MLSIRLLAVMPNIVSTLQTHMSFKEVKTPHYEIALPASSFGS